MNYKINFKNWGSNFAVPSSVVRKYMLNADEGYIKILLYILSEGEGSFITTELSEKTGVSENDIYEAVGFWASKNIISCDDISPEENKKDKGSIKAQSPEKAKIISEIEAVDPAAESISKKVSVRYSPKDIEKIVDESPELKFLMDNSQIILKRPIKYSEQGSLINLFEYYGFSAASILMLLEYCEKIGKTSIGYVEAIAKSWFENEIIDHIAVEREIIRLLDKNKLEKKIAAEFGIETKLTPTQIAFVEKWAKLGFDIDIISFAYEKCVDSTNKLSFPYINKILESWAEKGFKTREQIGAEKAPQNKRSKTKPQKEHSYDLEEFYRLALNSTPDFKGD